MTRFPRLFEPMQIGALELRNRVVFAAHGTGHALTSDSYLAYLGERARGGAGLIITQGTPTVPCFEDVFPKPFLYDDAIVPGLRRLSSAMHDQGAAILVQMFDIGGLGTAGFSSVPFRVLEQAVQPRALSVREIEDRIGFYVRGAVNARDGGMDGVEIHAAHGVGINQALSPLFNRRTDRFGGDWKGRATYLLEILSAVREAVGRQFVISVRLNADESGVGGYSLQDGVQTAALLAATGDIDLLNIDFGVEGIDDYSVVPSSYARPNPMAYAQKAVRDAVHPFPVLGGGRLHSPEQAEAALAEGVADLV